LQISEACSVAHSYRGNEGLYSNTCAQQILQYEVIYAACSTQLHNHSQWLQHKQYTNSLSDHLSQCCYTLMHDTKLTVLGKCSPAERCSPVLCLRTANMRLIWLSWRGRAAFTSQCGASCRRRTQLTHPVPPQSWAAGCTWPGAPTFSTQGHTLETI